MRSSFGPHRQLARGRGRVDVDSSLRTCNMQHARACACAHARRANAPPCALRARASQAPDDDEYMDKMHHYRYDEALLRLQAKRPIVQPNDLPALLGALERARRGEEPLSDFETRLALVKGFKFA